MDFFNKAKESLTSAGKGFTQKASDVSGAARLNMKIFDEEKSLKKLIEELGQTLFDQHSDEVRKLCPEQYFAITELQKQLEKDRRELVICKGMKICPNCGAEQEGHVMRCTVCGMDMAEMERMVEKKPEVVFCPGCGAALAPDAKFCTNCGQKML
jgi:ribosomal protein L40E